MSGDPRLSGAWSGLLAVAALLVLGFFLFSLREVLNPFLLLLVLLVILVPFRGMRGHSLVAGLAVALTMFWILDSTGFLLAPFVLALVLAYILDPGVDLLEARGLSRNLAILVLALPFAGGLVAAVIWGLPALGQQVGELIERVPVLLERSADWLDRLDERIAAMRLPPAAAETVDRIRAIDPEALVAFLEARQAEIARRVWEGVLGFGRGITSFLTVIGYVVLTPVLTFYLLRDWDGITATAADLVPPGRRGTVLGFASEYDDLLSSYLRGQLLVALTVGTITALGLWITGFPYAFLLGVLVAVFGLVPYLGLVLSLIPAILIALMSGAVGISLLKVAVVYAVAQGLEGAVISPKIVGGSVGLHPVWVVLALAVGGFFFGFVGLLIGVPLAVGVKLLVLRGLALYRDSDFYGQAPPRAAQG